MVSVVAQNVYQPKQRALLHHRRRHRQQHPRAAAFSRNSTQIAVLS